MTSDDQLYAVLHFDPLDFAEQVTGSSYKEDEETTALGFGFFQDQAKVKDAILTERGDTTFRNKLDRYVEIITAYGFRPVLDVPFDVHKYDKGYVYEEHMFVYWHEDGLLLVFTTYQEDNVNGGNVYYAWKANDPTSKDAWKWLASHDAMGDDGSVIGYHDCREALIFNLDQLRKHGKFLNPFPRPPHLWLGHYGEEDKIDYTVSGFTDHCDAIRKERISLLPDYVREAMGV